MSKVTVKQAAQLTGKTKETINKATNTGKLSFSLNASGHKVIDVSELERIYTLVLSVDELGKHSKQVSRRQVESDSDITAEVAVLREKLASSERMKEQLIAERERERRQLESEIDTLRSSLEKSQDQHGKALLLITDQSKDTTDGVGDWEKSYKGLEKRLANHEDRLRKEREERAALRKKAERYKQALESERRKPFWQRLLG